MVLRARNDRGSAPAPTGGTLVDGSDKLVSAVLYTGPGGAAEALPITIKATVALSGTTANIAQDTSVPSSQRPTVTVITTGSDLTVTQTRPKTETIAMKYSGRTDLTMFIRNDQGQIVAYTYRR